MKIPDKGRKINKWTNDYNMKIPYEDNEGRQRRTENKEYPVDWPQNVSKNESVFKDNDLECSISYYQIIVDNGNVSHKNKQKDIFR